MPHPAAQGPRACPQSPVFCCSLLYRCSSIHVTQPMVLSKSFLVFKLRHQPLWPRPTGLLSQRHRGATRAHPLSGCSNSTFPSAHTKSRPDGTLACSAQTHIRLVSAPEASPLHCCLNALLASPSFFFWGGREKYNKSTENRQIPKSLTPRNSQTVAPAVFAAEGLAATLSAVYGWRATPCMALRPS